MIVSKCTCVVIVVSENGVWEQLESLNPEDPHNNFCAFIFGHLAERTNAMVTIASRENVYPQLTNAGLNNATFWLVVYLSSHLCVPVILHCVELPFLSTLLKPMREWIRVYPPLFA